PDSAEIGPFFGWLCTRLTCYRESTLLLKTMAQFRGNGLRPAIELEPTDHPLAVDQREGISLRRAWEFIHRYQPGAGAWHCDAAAPLRGPPNLVVSRRMAAVVIVQYDPACPSRFASLAGRIV